MTMNLARIDACITRALCLTCQPVSLYESEGPNMSLRAKFSVMMFLEFFIWGAWLPLAFPFLLSLGFGYWEISFFMNAFAIASITGLFFSNQFADRNFAAEKFLAFSHLIGGV